MLLLLLVLSNTEFLLTLVQGVECLGILISLSLESAREDRCGYNYRLGKSDRAVASGGYWLVVS